MDDGDNMNFLEVLLAIHNDLKREDVAALKFLCSDFIFLRRLEDVESAQDLFQLLINEDLLTKEDPFFLAELLYLIKYHKLLPKLGYSAHVVEEKLPRKGKVSEYRQMLYELSEQLIEEDVRSAIFFLRDYLPKKQSTLSALDLLASMEKQDLLSEDNLQMLEKICDQISPDLLKRVEKYKKNQGVKGGNTVGLTDLSMQQSAENEESKTVAEKPAVYKMDGPRRGYCIIFNNVNFGKELQRRPGSLMDATELEIVFSWLGLEVTKYDDMTSSEMEKILKKWQSSEKLKGCDCFVCCILSHGKSGSVYGTDEGQIPVRSIMTYFTANRCPQLAQKPKLFFIQACQGKEIHKLAYLEADGREYTVLGADAQASGQFLPQRMPSIPEEADFLLGMATVDGYCSFRNVHWGSWYIQALCKQLRSSVPRGEDILSILTEVNNEVSTYLDYLKLQPCKQMPQPAYTLRKKLIFPVPLEPPPPSQQQ